MVLIGASSTFGPYANERYSNEKCFIKSTVPSPYHPKSKTFFKSLPALLQESNRYLEESRFLVHQLSLFSFGWQTVMACFYYMRLIIGPLRLCFVFDSLDSQTKNCLDYTMLIIQSACLLDIVMIFNKSYFDVNEQKFIFKRSKIAKRYLLSWFAIDLLSSLPLSFIVIHLGTDRGRILLFTLILPNLSLFRMRYNWRHFDQVLEFISKECNLYLSHLVKLLMVLHWFTCLTYLVSTIHYYTSGKESLNYNKLLRFYNRPLSSIPFEERYWRASFITVASFLSTGYTMFNSSDPYEIIVSVFVMLASELFIIYTIVLFLLSYTNRHNSVSKYYEMMNVVENYMQSKQFTPDLKKRIIGYYSYKYHCEFYREASVLKGVSEHLCNEIELDMRRKLVANVSLLRGLPKELSAKVLACLRYEVYLPGDMITRAGDVGHCMYFIASGTVACYTSKGAEVGHFEDGAHFGEVAIVMNDMRRIATVVAIQNTEVYRLDRSDFRNTVMTNDIFYTRIMTVAIESLNNTVRLDEETKRQMCSHSASISHQDSRQSMYM